MRSRVWTCLGALVLLSAACSSSGSHANKNKQGALSLGPQSGFPGAAGPASAGSDTTIPGSATAAGGPAGAGGAASGGTSSGGGAATPNAATPLSPAAAPPAAPVSNTPVLVGAYGLGAGQASGVTGATLGDPVKMSNAMAAWVNSHGGLGGHPVKLVQAETDVTSSTPTDQQDQAACAKFTEDNHVFAVVSIVVTTPGFYDCLEQKGVFYIANSIAAPDSAYYAAHPNTLFSTSPSQDRVGVTTADDLERQGYFKDPGAKFGVVFSDHPWWRAGATAFEQRAATYGVKVVQELALCRVCSTQEQTNESQNGIVRFRNAGVNHVILLLDSPASTFVNNAAAAAYYPRLGMNSTNLPEVLAVTEPPQSFTGAVGAGFMPATDVEAAQDVAQTQPMQLCTKIMNDAGQTFPTRLTLEQARFTCDGFWFLKAAMDRDGGNASPARLHAVINTMGGGYVPAMTWTDWYGPGRQDGAQTFRPFAWSTGCRCFTYVGGEAQMTPLPGQPK